MERIYLDYASTTPIDPEVEKSLAPFIKKSGDYFGNPGSLHFFGQKASALVNWSRNILAKSIFAEERELFFTSSATESNNLAIRGIVEAFLKNNPDVIPKVITSPTEHPSVLETLKSLEENDRIKISYLPVSRNGLVDLKNLKKELDKKTILVSLMWVNNETGIIQPIKEVSKIISDFKKSSSSIYPFFHSDAAQAFLFEDINVGKFGTDLITLSSHKIYGPKGAGLIYVDSEILNKNLILPEITGGGQENGLRSGTENVFSIFGFASAAQLLHKRRNRDRKKVGEISDYFLSRILKEIPGVEINGDLRHKSPHIINLFVPKVRNLQTALDAFGVAVSSGSACSQKFLKPSPVLESMGFDKERSSQSLRFSFGRFTSKKEIDKVIKIIKKVISRS